jgi:ligand-binding sensor domain-containing protein/signal transduction histidine kinase
MPRLPVPSLVALLFAGAIAFGAPAQNDYFYRGWRINNGLTENSVNTVLQDPHGYLWLATLTGLARFDGLKFEEFPLPPDMRNSGENIRALAQEDPSTLVMLPASGGVVRLSDGRFSRHPADAAVRGHQLEQLFVEPDGALWMGDYRGEILRWKSGSLTTFGAKDGIAYSLVGLSVATDGQGRTWVAQGDFLGWFDRGKLVRFPGSPGTLLVIAPARDGGLWISAAERLLKLKNGRLTTLLEAPEWPSAREVVQRLFEDSQGVLWIATRRNGLYRFEGGQVRATPTQQQILSWVAEDSEHGVWVASKGGGIARLQRRRFVMIRPGADQDDIASTAVCEDNTGATWCANRDGGVFRYFGGTVERVQVPQGNPPFYANCVCPDADGTIWVGTKSGLYRVVAGNPLTLEMIAPDLKDIHVLYLSRKGELWIGSENKRLLRFRGGKFEEIMANEGSPEKAVTAMTETDDGTLWIAVQNELYSFIDGRLVRRNAYDGFPGEHISALYGDSTGALWIGTSRGLLRLKDGRLTAFTQASGLPNDRIKQMLEDGNGIFWLSTLRGFFRVSRADLEAVADGRASRVAAVTFGPEEGLTGQTPVYNCQPDTWRGSDNRLWFCTQDGVIGIDANSVPLQLPPPPVYINQVLVDGRPADRSGLRLSTGQHRLAFDFSSPSFAAPEKVRIHYRLVGFDNSWIETVPGQEANFAGLPAGRYTLEVAASDPYGIWREGIGASLPFAVVPMWWDTWCARLLALGAFTGLVVWIARYTSHSLLKRRLKRIEQEHALEKERARIARDLHDELGGSLTQITLLADRLRRRADKPELEPGLRQLARKTRQLAGELESIIWTVNPRNNSLDRLAHFTRQFTQRFLRDTGIECSVLGVEEIPARRISPEIQHHLLTATKEALNNALKHSQAGSVTVEFRFSQEIFTTVIRDDGVGFNPEAAENKERNGLSNLRSRLREIGGIVDIRSSPGLGAEISWRVPLAGALVPDKAPLPVHSHS